MQPLAQCQGHQLCHQSPHLHYIPHHPPWHSPARSSQSPAPARNLPHQQHHKNIHLVFPQGPVLLTFCIIQSIVMAPASDQSLVMPPAPDQSPVPTLIPENSLVPALAPELCQKPSLILETPKKILDNMSLSLRCPLCLPSSLNLQCSALWVSSATCTTMVPWTAGTALVP